MRKPLALIAVPLLAVACADPGNDPVAPRQPGAPSTDIFGEGPVLGGPISGGPIITQKIPDEYIVVLKEQADVTGVIASTAFGRGGGIAPHVVYSIINGFAAHLSAAELAALSQNPDVDYIEPDQEMTISTTQTGATWGLDRIDQRALPLSTTYTYTKTGTGIHAYIIDTGILTSHPDFGGRASVAYDALGGNGQDCNGHGTHVSGTVGGTKYGVAKGVTLHAVRVLDCNGSGSTSGVIAGMNWVRLHAIKPAVANMSLGGGASTALNTAANNLASSGVFLAVAAGNSSANACRSSPSGASGAFAVAASSNTDTRASFSNYGSCVKVYAPGVSITSDWLSGGTNTISGTSMASPHVAGVAVLYKSTFGDASSTTVGNWIVTNSTPNVITGNPAGTPNRLLFKSTL